MHGFVLSAMSMHSDFISFAGLSAGCRSVRSQSAWGFGRAKPPLDPAEVIFSLAVSPDQRAWSQPGRARRSPPDGPRPDIYALEVEFPPPWWKRAIDLAACGCGLPLLALCTLVMFLLTRRYSPGPVIFRQERIGHLGRRFRIYKFRTMKLGADSTVHQDYCRSLIHSNAPMVKLDNRGDARLIPGAWVLRALGLDELPQLLNVLRGEMSLVGPRPCLPAEFEQFESWQRRRCDARPGLTGLWQVSGKNRTTFDQMMRLDVRYACQNSPWLDLKIIVLTLPCLLAQIRDGLRARALRAPAASPGSRDQARSLRGAG